METGRRNNDLYSQLESEIDAARKKYEKRIDSKLTEKDYFDAAIVELLADGVGTKMGPRYAQIETH